MRSSGGRLRKTDMKKLQQSAEQKVCKQVQALTQLIQLPDFDVSQFFQTLLKSHKHEEVLSRIPKEKQIDFFARNFQSFLQTQDQLIQLQLPTLDQIPKAKEYYLNIQPTAKEEENNDEATVMEIIDSFSTHALQKILSKPLESTRWLWK